MNESNSLNKILHQFSWRPYQENDYFIASKWWLSYNQAFLEKHFLPPSGVVIIKDEKPIVMGWIYFSNSQIAQLSWVVSDPKLGPKSKFVAVTMLLEIAENIIKAQGFDMIQMLSDRKGLTRMSKRSGFKTIRRHDFLVKYILSNGTRDDKD